MDRSQTLREVFDRLAAGEPATVPADLEPGLVSHALRDYADTAPIEVAEHLEPFTSTVGGVDGVAPDAGLDLLGTAPATPVEEFAPAEDAPHDAQLEFGAGLLDFGSGSDVGGDAAVDDTGATSADHDLTEDLTGGLTGDVAGHATGEQAGHLADEVGDDPGLGAHAGEPWWTDLLGDATDVADAVDAPDDAADDLDTT